jgi:hypothetical protein
LDIACQLSNNAITPLRCLDLPAYMFANLPIESNQFRVDGAKGPMFGRLDERYDFVKLRLPNKLPFHSQLFVFPSFRRSFCHIRSISLKRDQITK